MPPVTGNQAPQVVQRSTPSAQAPAGVDSKMCAVRERPQPGQAKPGATASDASSTTLVALECYPSVPKPSNRRLSA
jgi:hypothetical protein